MASSMASAARFSAAHNLHTGMPDFREDSLTQLAGDETQIMLQLAGDVMDSLQIDATRAPAECRLD
jgi:hypothetical protein